MFCHLKVWSFSSMLLTFFSSKNEIYTGLKRMSEPDEKMLFSVCLNHISKKSLRKQQWFPLFYYIYMYMYTLLKKYWLIEYCSSSRSRTAHSYREVTIVGERVQNLDPCSVLTVVEQGGIFVVPMGAEALFLPTSPQDPRRTVYWKASVCEEKKNLGKVVTLSV